MKRLTTNQIIAIHKELIRSSGGSDGIRDIGLLESAMNAPFQIFGGDFVYPSLQQKAARLCFGIINNHAFIDGNKRIGILAMLVFLEINGVELVFEQDELIDIGLALASNSMNDKELLEWILSHS